MAWDPSGDFAAVVDGLEAITLRRRTDLGQSALAVRVAHARRSYRRQRTELKRALGTVAEDRVLWSFPASEVTAHQPTLGDKIIGPDDRTYYIVRVEELTLARVVRCETIDGTVLFTEDLDFRVRTQTKGNAGEVLAEWSDGGDFSCRVQRVQAEDGASEDRRSLSGDWRIYADRDACVSIGLANAVAFPDWERVRLRRGGGGPTWRIVRITDLAEIPSVVEIEADVVEGVA